MINIVTPRRHASARHRGATLLVALFASILPAGAQEAHAETPDPAIFDARYEEAFAAAVAMPDDTEPTDVLQAWGVAMMSAVMVDRARAIAELGENAPPPDGEAVNEQVLARWQQMRPESGGPDLFRALSIRDPATKRAAIIGLLDRYPDNVLVVSQALQQWLHAGEAARAVDVAETFLARNPDHPLAYGLLLQAMDSNETLLIDALRRWAQVAPGEPRLLVTFGWHLFGRQRLHPFGRPAACRLALARLLMQATLRPNKRRLSGFHAMKARGISSLRSGLHRQRSAYRLQSTPMKPTSAQPPVSIYSTENAIRDLRIVAEYRISPS